MKKIMFIVMFLIGAVFANADTISPRVETLSIECTAKDSSCNIVKDQTIGTCRTIDFATDKGLLGIRICAKDGARYELYKTQAPSNLEFNACVGAGCVTETKGYDSFTSDKLPPTTDGYRYKPVGEFPLSCKMDKTKPCHVNTDRVDGTCRRVTFKSDWGRKAGLRICHKEGSRYEVYYLHFSNKNFEVCAGPACVTRQKGFDSFSI